MHNQFDTEAEPIDLEHWDRRPLFEYFSKFDEPYHSVCVRVDCTETFLLAKQKQYSVFLSLAHRALVAAHKVQHFRTRIEKDQVLVYRTIHAGSAVGRDNGTIAFGYFAFHPDLEEFVSSGSRALARIKEEGGLERFPTQNLIRFSVLPWLDFTSISHARLFARQDSAPWITFGKISELHGRHTMPVSIHVHHALVDGLHVGQFVQQFEQLLASPQLTV